MARGDPLFSRGARRCAVGLALALLLGCSKPEGARVEGPLALEIPELCTVCVEVLRCDGSARRVAYVLAENDSRAQIATIWDYFAAFFRPKTEDFRVLTVYELGARLAEVLSVLRGQRARLDVWNRRVELPGVVVDQRNAAWLTADGRPIGTCRLLPRGEDRRYAKSLEEAPA